jgi:hypothetical protein
MAAGIEDVVAVKALETGCVPPVANFKEVDPELGALNLSKGGIYPVEYALRLGAGFGSQISMSLVRWVTTQDGTRRGPNALGYAYRIADATAWNGWLSRVAGYPTADVEVVHRTLRVRDQGPAAARLAEPARVAQSAPVSLPKTPPAPIVDRKPEVPVPPAPISEVTQASLEVPAAKPTPPPPPKSGAPPATAVGDAVRERILSLVAEKTGYPVDMLDLDLDLEADLGVDFRAMTRSSCAIFLHWLT